MHYSLAVIVIIGSLFGALEGRPQNFVQPFFNSFNDASSTIQSGFGSGLDNFTGLMDRFIPNRRRRPAFPPGAGSPPGQAKPPSQANPPSQSNPPNQANPPGQANTPGQAKPPSAPASGS